jgi:hypothetical protein
MLGFSWRAIASLDIEATRTEAAAASYCLNSDELFGLPLRLPDLTTQSKAVPIKKR